MAVHRPPVALDIRGPQVPRRGRMRGNSYPSRVKASAQIPVALQKTICAGFSPGPRFEWPHSMAFAEYVEGGGAR